MIDFRYQGEQPPAVGKEDEQTNGLTRRTVVAGAVATTMAVGTLATPASARSTSPNSSEDMVLFLLLSSALTGIAASRLSPGFFLGPRPNPPAVPAPSIDLSKSMPGPDPFDLIRGYLTWANERRPLALEKLLRLVRENLNSPNRDQAIISALQFGDDDKTKTPADTEAKYLARSIALMWYLGAWYDPAHLRKIEHDETITPFFEVISPIAYTQGWALRAAQAHPIGFSQMQFGYWGRLPNPLREFI
jgi:hypothetical protein